MYLDGLAQPRSHFSRGATIRVRTEVKFQLLWTNHPWKLSCTCSHGKAIYARDKRSAACRYPGCAGKKYPPVTKRRTRKPSPPTGRPATMQSPQNPPLSRLRVNRTSPGAATTTRARPNTYGPLHTHTTARFSRSRSQHSFVWVYPIIAVASLRVECSAAKTESSIHQYFLQSVC
jgi:hypothetical protein